MIPETPVTATPLPPAAPSGPATPAESEPPTLADVAWFGAIAAVKATIVALAVDAFVNSDTPRFSGKGMRIRAVGYTGTLLLVPVAWRLLGRRSPYPRALDLAVALPLLADAGGNAIGIYRRAHVDDLIHFANGALFTAVVGAVVTPRARTSWEAAAAAGAAGTAAAGAWEMAEWIGLKLGAKGMDLSYDDTMADLIETTAGAMLGALVTLLRHPARLRQVPGAPADPIVASRGHGGARPG
ncbi:MAG TPA: hypothetical protein VFY23_14195 [Candidatus Limnocylindrales bacterium]|nr:hypothetical protein [Candidatus Limnocylindrales bacterium]